MDGSATIFLQILSNFLVVGSGAVFLIGIVANIGSFIKKSRED